MHGRAEFWQCTFILLFLFILLSALMERPYSVSIMWQTVSKNIGVLPLTLLPSHHASHSCCPYISHATILFPPFHLSLMILFRPTLTLTLTLHPRPTSRPPHSPQTDIRPLSIHMALHPLWRLLGAIPPRHDARSHSRHSIGIHNARSVCPYGPERE